MVSTRGGALIYELFTERLRGGPAVDALEPIAIPAAEVREQTTDAEFVRAIIEGGAISPDFGEGMRYMEFCEAAAISLHRERTVTLPLEQGEMQC